MLRHLLSHRGTVIEHTVICCRKCFLCSLALRTGRQSGWWDLKVSLSRPVWNECKATGASETATMLDCCTGKENLAFPRCWSPGVSHGASFIHYKFRTGFMNSGKNQGFKICARKNDFYILTWVTFNCSVQSTPKGSFAPFRDHFHKLWLIAPFKNTK